MRRKEKTNPKGLRVDGAFKVAQEISVEKRKRETGRQISWHFGEMTNITLLEKTGS